jgi:predicted PurR-regulated permease PerM
LLIVVDSPLKAFLFIVFILVLQQLENNLIYPRVVGTSIGLPGIWVLAAITVGSGVAGIIGMLLGVPITATLYQLLRDATNKRAPAKPQKKAEAAEK